MTTVMVTARRATGYDDLATTMTADDNNNDVDDDGATGDDNDDDDDGNGDGAMGSGATGYNKDVKGDE